MNSKQPDKQPSTDQSKQLINENQSLHALLDFVCLVTRMKSTDDAIWHVAHHIIEQLGFSDCVIYLFRESDEKLFQAAAYGPKNPLRKVIVDIQERTLGEGITGKAAQQKATILINDVRKESDYIEDGMAGASELAVPIVHRGQLLGVIDSENEEKNFYTPQHQWYLETLAATLASKIAMDRNINELETSVNELTHSERLLNTFYQISELTHDSQSETEFYRSLHKIISDQVHSESFFVCLHEKTANRYWFPFLYDRNGEVLDFELNEDQYAQSLIIKTMQEGHPKLYQYQELKNFSKTNQIILLSKIPRSWLSMPFVINDNLSASITLQSYQKDVTFQESDIQFLKFIAQHISTAITRQQQDQRLLQLALHDVTTNLPNRALFLDRLSQAFLKADRDSTKMAVLFIDMDNFKQVNDQFGHHSGDQLLKQAAGRMQRELRRSDTIARLGGDEFAIIIEDFKNRSAATNAAKRILISMQHPFQFEGQEIFISSSVGIAFNDKAATAHQLLTNADHAMYHAKHQGKNNYQIYEDKLHSRLMNTRQLVKELERAIDNKELTLYYQPILNLKTGKVLGFEALLRWMHPKRGIVPPGEFIEIAEQSDLIKLIDKQIMQLAARQVTTWRKQFQSDIYVGINISAQRFGQEGFFDDVTEVIERYSVEEGSMVLEITEHLLMENFETATRTIESLKKLGLKISLDDFGTGYSSLSYLNQLSFDLVKIDQSFVKQMDNLEQDYPIVSTIIALSRTLGMKVIAEGIENPLQLKMLKQLSCWLGQGYFIARPMAVEQATELLENQHLFGHLTD